MIMTLVLYMLNFMCLGNVCVVKFGKQSKLSVWD